MKAWRTPERILPVEEIPVLAIANRMMPFVAVYFDGEWHCYHTNQRLNVFELDVPPLTMRIRLRSFAILVWAVVFCNITTMKSVVFLWHSYQSMQN